MSQDQNDIEYAKSLPIVWLTEERKFAWLVQEGAHYAVVVWGNGSNFTRQWIEPDEYVVWEERAINYESE